MSSPVEIIIATYEWDGYTRVAKQVDQAREELELSPDACHVQQCLTLAGIQAAITNAEQRQAALLIISEPRLEPDARDTFPLLRDQMRTHPDRVFVLNLGDLPLGNLPIPEEQVVVDLGDRELQQLKDHIRQFLIKHAGPGLQQYNLLARRVEEYERWYRSPRMAFQATGASPGGAQSAYPPALPHEGPKRVAVLAARNIEVSTEVVSGKWDELAKDIEKKAHETFSQVLSSRDETEQSNLLAVAHALLRLALGTRLNQLRAHANYAVCEAAQGQLGLEPHAIFPPGYGIGKRNERRETIKKVRDRFREYFKRQRCYDKTLRRHKIPVHFRRQFGDAEQFRAWSEDFGPERFSNKDEPGWGMHADNVSRELRYYYRDALRHEHCMTPSQRLVGLLLWIFKWVAGFGLRPWRALITSALILSLFAVAHAVDDIASGCYRPSLTVHSILATVQRYASISVLSLTSLGSTSPPCGHAHIALVALESILGYFLLAILTTLFIQAALDR